MITPSFATGLRRVSGQASRAGGRLAKKRASLTSREMKILQMIAEGNANKKFATKLDLHDTAGLSPYAISEGINESSVHFTIE